SALVTLAKTQPDTRPRQPLQTTRTYPITVIAVLGELGSFMSRWIVLVTPVGGVAAEASSVRTLAEFEGSAEEAMARFAKEVNSYDLDVTKVKRREVFKCSDRSYFVRVNGRLLQFEYFFQLAELVADTKSADLPDTIS
ncbi:hypothetical protein, partial [Streptomyces virginiae]|uniref:hypothetical protein n=2 Tax=Streptomyces TaxID=1883 RepID=UPI001BDE4A9C